MRDETLTPMSSFAIPGLRALVKESMKLVAMRLNTGPTTISSARFENAYSMVNSTLQASSASGWNSQWPTRLENSRPPTAGRAVGIDVRVARGEALLHAREADQDGGLHAMLVAGLDLGAATPGHEFRVLFTSATRSNIWAAL